MIVDEDPNGLAKTVELVEELNQEDVDLYAWITNTRDDSGTAGVAYIGGACDNSRWYKTSINSGPTLSSSGGIIVLAHTLSHEIGHNLGMSHDFEGEFGGESDKVCRKNSDGSSLNCVSCDNFYNADYEFYANPSYVSYRKLSPVTGSANDCCTGIMDYQNSPKVWSSCSVRFFEQHYEAKSWFQCMSDATYCSGISYDSLSFSKFVLI